MKSTDVPAGLVIPFASQAAAGYVRDIPRDAQAATTTDAPASLVQGFPPATFTPESAGGVPPNGQDMNGILRVLSAWARWQKAGGPNPFDGGWANGGAGGYPLGARVASATVPGRTWVSRVDNNLRNPDADSTDWSVLTDEGHSYDLNNGYVTVGPLIINFGHTAASSTGFVDVTFAKPFAQGALFPGATNDSGVSNPSSWPGVGNVSRTGMRIGMSVPRSGGGADPALAGTAAFWWCGGI